MRGRPLNVLPDERDLRDQWYTPGLADIKNHVPIPDIYKPVSDRKLERRRRRETIRQQGLEGSCTGQALASIIDIQLLRRKFGKPTGDFETLSAEKRFEDWKSSRVSSRMLYDMARTYEFAPESQLQGSSLRNVLKAFHHNGVCREEEAAYEPFDTSWSLTYKLAKSARGNSLGAYYRLRARTYDYHAAVLEAGSILVSAMIHEGWELESVRETAVNDDNIKRIRYEEGSRLIGAHAFVVVGYCEEGFYVLNSWGGNWGRSDDAGTPGIALWTYEDWRRHVIDAWVIRLASSSPLARLGPGGFGRGIDPISGKILSNTPRLRITGHYINLYGNRFVRRGRYPNDASVFEQSANKIFAVQSKFKRLAIFFLSGMSNLKSDARRVEGMLNLAEANGTYPLFVFWNYIDRNHVEKIIEANFDALIEKHGTDDTAMNFRLERELRDFGALFWDRMFAQINAATESNELPLFGALSPFIETAISRAKTIQLIVHSDGALLMEAFLESFSADKAKFSKLASSVSRISLVSPLCLYPQKNREPLKRLVEVRNGHSIEVITYPERVEAQDQIGVYQGNYPKLVQNVFYPHGSEADLGGLVLGLHSTGTLMRRRRLFKHLIAETPMPGESISHFDMIWTPGVARKIMNTIRE